MSIVIRDCGRVRARCELRVPLPASAVWGQMRDFRRFLTLDPLHVRVEEVRGSEPRGEHWPRGAEFLIEHRLLGLGAVRRGRVLSWKEGRGFAISDLSNRGARKSFPHVCTYEVVPEGEHASRLILGAAGRWTARWVPRPLVRAWLWWVLKSTELHIQTELRAVSRRSARRWNPSTSRSNPSTYSDIE